jgi:hypothetical protein
MGGVACAWIAGATVRAASIVYKRRKGRIIERVRLIGSPELDDVADRLYVRSMHCMVITTENVTAQLVVTLSLWDGAAASIGCLFLLTLPGGYAKINQQMLI